MYVLDIASGPSEDISGVTFTAKIIDDKILNKLKLWFDLKGIQEKSQCVWLKEL